MNIKTLPEYLLQIQSKGRLSFSLQELQDNFDLSLKAIQQSLYRLKVKRVISQIRKEFYVIVPPQYRSIGTLPTELYLDDMMNFLKKEYYFSFYSAAAIHGAAHQQPMTTQIIIKSPSLRNIRNEKQFIDFLTKSKWNPKWVEKVKTETGYICVSSVELTLFDLVHYHNKIGGLNRVFPIIEELLEKVKASQLKKIAKEVSSPTLQRTGYLLELLNEKKFCSIIEEIINEKKKSNIPLLSMNHRNENAEINQRWNLRVNLEIDLE